MTPNRSPKVHVPLALEKDPIRPSEALFSEVPHVHQASNLLARREGAHIVEISI